MHKTFSDAFNEHLEKTGARVTNIATKSGVKKDSLYALKRGTTRNMGVDDAIRVAAAFGETVEEFMGLSPAQVRDQLVEQIARLTPSEQAILEASLTAILSQREGSDPAEPQGAKTTKPPVDQTGD
jgi:plasmid maintenance system antidote protein VapI